MKIAIPKLGNEVSSHFGQSEGFIIYEVDIDNLKVISKKATDGNVKGCHAAPILKKLGVDKVLAGGMGEGAKRNLEAVNIEVLMGVTGDLDTAIKNYMEDSLTLDESCCGGHDHDHDDNHECCGHHSH